MAVIVSTVVIVVVVIIVVIVLVAVFVCFVAVLFLSPNPSFFPNLSLFSLSTLFLMQSSSHAKNVKHSL